MFKKIRLGYLLLVALFKKRRKEVVIFGLGSVLVLLALFSFDRISSEIYSNTKDKLIKPTYSEAVVGQLNTFNPLFSKMEAEKEINQLVFRSLIKVMPSGEIKADLAEKYESKNDIEFTFYLKKNIYWQDGKKFSAEDVLYTIQLGQNSLYNSEIEETFRDVEVIKKDEYTVIFRLKEPFSPFINALTVGIIPKHITLSNYRPIGTGAFRFVEIKKDYTILEGKNVRLKFIFYPTLKAAQTALKLSQAHGLANFGSNTSPFHNWNNYQVKQAFVAFRQVMVFFNTREENLAEKNLRQALAYATPKAEILKSPFGQKGKLALNSLPNISKFQANTKEKYAYNLDKSNNLLANSGWILQDGFRYKNGKKLALTITTLADSEFEDSALKLRDSWSKLGAQIDIELVSGNELKNQIVPKRSFAVLLTSQLLSPDPDQYVLWHTTQSKQSNISGIASAKIDKLLEDGRKTSNPKIRAEKYQEFTRILLDEAPAIFLYYPSYNWLVSKRISNIDLTDFRVPEDRFKNVVEWKIKNPLF